MESLTFDLATTPLRTVNQYLHQQARAGLRVLIVNPDCAHAIYYAAGMNQLASVVITGSAGTGVADNMMSGKVHVKGFASNAAGATAQGGLLVIDGDAGLRCAISLKGADV